MLRLPLRLVAGEEGRCHDVRVNGVRSEMIWLVNEEGPENTLETF